MVAVDKKQTKIDLSQTYGLRFYESQMDGSLRSAKVYAAILSKIFMPRSAVDVGCGRGTWLKAFGEAGATRLTGYDGPWNTQENMVDQAIEFTGMDLNSPARVSAERFDLAMSLEVAEHLHPSTAEAFIGFLTDLSDAVLFGAAYPGQGGANHINEQKPSYWANLFGELGYLPFDLFRPVVWGSPEVEFWYQQNTFLYVRTGSKVAKLLAETGQKPLSNFLFMDCVHPALFEAHSNRKLKTMKLIRMLLARAVPMAQR